MRRAVIALLLAVTLVLVGCTPTQLVNAFNSSDLEVTKNIAYGDLPRQTLDVYSSSQLDTPEGTVVFVHGGSWNSGDKSQYAFVANALVAEGYAVVIPNYRLVPEVVFPAYVNDIALAVQWTFQNAGEGSLAAAPDDIFIMGHSAGAHIAGMVAFDETFLEAVSVEPNDLAGFVGLAGPYDFLPLGPDDDASRAALGPPENYPRTQPINFVDGNDIPAFLATGLADTVVNPNNSVSLAEKIENLGGETTLKTYEGVDHAGIVGGLASVSRVLAPDVLGDIVAFLEAQSE